MKCTLKRPPRSANGVGFKFLISYKKKDNSAQALPHFPPLGVAGGGGGEGER